MADPPDPDASNATTELVPVAVELVATRTAARPSVHPVAAYLARLSPGSRATQRVVLDAIAGMLVPDATAEGIPWHQLRYAHTQAVRSALAARYAPATANRALAALRGVLKECRRLGLMSPEDEAQAGDLEPVKGKRLPAGRALATVELAALFAACDRTTVPGARDAALLAVLYGCGLRRAELAALDLVDFDPGESSLRVLGKGNKERTCYLPDDAAAALRAWVLARGEGPGALLKSLDPVRPHDRLTPQGVLVILRRLGTKAGVAKFTPHDARRTFISNLLDAGADLATVQAMAGHASPITTARYDRRGESAKKRAAALLKVPR